MKDVVRFVSGLLDATLGSDGFIATFLRDQGEKLVTLASFVFAVWRWWVYREAILHKRLEEYITESDQRLEPASRDVMEAILRPGRSPTIRQPSFARELQSILNHHTWQTRWTRLPFIHESFEVRTRRKILGSLKDVRKRLSVAQKATASLHEQYVQSHLIAGALAAARARRSTRKHRERYDIMALREFQHVLQQPGHSRNIQAKENEAFQLLRLGKLDVALSAFIELRDFAAHETDAKRRDFTISRAKRYEAQIRQLQAGSAGRLVAYNLMQAAIPLRQKHQPHQDWDAIEQAEMHFLTAYMANRLNFRSVESGQLNLAAQHYDLALHYLPKRRWFLKRSAVELRAEARKGKLRITSAQKGEYDLAWLGFASQKTQEGPEAVSKGTSDDSVEQHSQGEAVHSST